MLSRTFSSCFLKPFQSQLLVRKTIPPLYMSAFEENKWVSHYSGPESDIEDICSQFSALEAGKIDLLKDESTGIATIVIDHPERRNALSGNLITSIF